MMNVYEGRNGFGIAKVALGRAYCIALGASLLVFSYSLEMFVHDRGVCLIMT